MPKKKKSGFLVFVNEKRDLNPEWRNKSASELEQLCQPLWQRLSLKDRNLYKEIKMELNTIGGQLSTKGEVRDGGLKEIKNRVNGGLFGGYGGLPSIGAGGYGAGYGAPFGRGGYGGPLCGGYGGLIGGMYGGVGSYGGPIGGMYGGVGGYSSGYGVGVGYGEGYGGGRGPAQTSFVEEIRQRMLKAKNDAQSNEVKSRAVVHISETQVVKLEETLDQIDKMKDYEDQSSSGNSFLATLQQNHEANAERTKGEIPKLKAREESNPVKDYVTREPSQMLPDVDLKLKQKNKEKMTNPRYTKMLEFRRKLPAYSMRKDLVHLIDNNQVVLVSGETGCGKTTQVPQFILDQCISAGRGAACRVVCTQPRRIAATSVAERVANERGEALGDSVGFQIRLESRLPRKNGSILFCTTGVVLQWLRSVPLIDDVSHIVLDEIHERDILSDLLLAILKDLLPRRPDLKLILMSATLNAEKFSSYYDNCPIITIPGFTYPVEEFYLEDVVEMTGFRFNPSEEKFKKEKHKDEQDFTKMIKPFLREIEASGSYSKQTIDFLRSKESENQNLVLIANLVKHIHEREKDGAILVFVPGWSEITQLNRMFEKNPKFRLEGNLVIYTLHSMMTTGYQREIFERPQEGTRKIIIATNIAETSITVDDVVYVVNCGGIKVTNFDERANLNSLDTQWVSLANARQRRGRAGRVQEGKCYHLYTRAREKLLDPYLLPEMLRTRLEEVILQIKVLELGDAKKFLKKVLDPPSDKTIALSMELLLTINAVITKDDGLEELTPLGYHLAKLPVDPLIGKMILLSAIFSCLDPILSIAACLSFKEPFVIPLDKEKLVNEKREELANNTMSDHLTIANAMAGWETSTNREEFCFEYFLSQSVMNMLLKLKQQYAQHLYNQHFLNSPSIWSMDANKNSHNEDLVRAVVCAGLYPNVAKLKRHLNPKGNNGKDKTKLMSKIDPQILFHMKSTNVDVKSFPYPWVVYHQKIKSTSVNFYNRGEVKVNLHDSSVVSPLSLLLFGRYVKVGQETMGGTGQKVDWVAADDFAKLNCEAATGELVHKLRGHLDQLLLHKFKYPAPTDWSKSQREGLVLECIVELLSSELSPEIERQICASNSITDFFNLVSKTWEGQLILINSMLPTRLLLRDDCDTTEVLMKDENGNALSSKNALFLRRSFNAFSSDAMFLVLRSSSTTEELAQTEIIQSRPVRDRVADLKKEQEAGIISLQLKKSSVVLYCFPPSEFSTGLLKRAAGKFSDEVKKEDYLVAVVVRETHNYDQAILDSIDEILTAELKSFTSEKIGAKQFTFEPEKKDDKDDQYGVDVSKGVNC